MADQYKDTRDKARRDAQTVLEELWDGVLPIDPAVIARKLGIKVVEANMHPKVSGIIRKRKGEDPVIALSREDSPARQRFTCAHEIGHFIQRQQDESFEFVDQRTTEYIGSKPMEEVYADEFAANLLMPKDAVTEVGRPDDVSKLWQSARRFGVSVDAFKVRLNKLEL